MIGVQTNCYLTRTEKTFNPKVFLDKSTTLEIKMGWYGQKIMNELEILLYSHNTSGVEQNSRVLSVAKDAVAKGYFWLGRNNASEALECSCEGTCTLGMFLETHATTTLSEEILQHCGVNA